MDPISQYLKDYFDSLPKIIVAYNHTHCRIACRKLKIPYNHPVFISTSDPHTHFRLMGMWLYKSQVYIYETAHWGKYYHETIRELRARYVD